MCPPVCLSTIQWVSVSTFLIVYYLEGQCVRPSVCLPFSGSVYLPTIHWVSVSAYLSVSRANTVTVSAAHECPPTKVYQSVRLSVYHSVGQYVHFLTIYYSLGQCVHPSVCLPLNWSVCPPLCLPTIQWFSENTFWLSTIEWVSVSTL